MGFGRMLGKSSGTPSQSVQGMVLGTLGRKGVEGHEGEREGLEYKEEWEFSLPKPII